MHDEYRFGKIEYRTKMNHVFHLNYEYPFLNMSHRGRSLSLAEKEMLMNVKHYFDKEKRLFSQCKKLCSQNPTLRTALATNVSEITV